MKVNFLPNFLKDELCELLLSTKIKIILNKKGKNMKIYTLLDENRSVIAILSYRGLKLIKIQLIKRVF